jgi:hypothetical protein
MQRSFELLVRTPVRGEVLRFSARSPDAWFTARGVAPLSISRRPQVEQALCELATEGFIDSKSVGSLTLYSLTRDAGKRAAALEIGHMPPDLYDRLLAQLKGSDRRPREASWAKGG